MRKKVLYIIDTLRIYSDQYRFYINIAKLLNINWYETKFLNPSLILKNQLNKFGIKYINYKDLIKEKNKHIKIITWNWYWCNKITNKYDKIFIENWYFWKDIQISDKWINANSHISILKYEDILSYKKKDVKKLINEDFELVDIKYNFYNYYILGFLSQNPIQSIKEYLIIKKVEHERKLKEKILEKEKELTLKKSKYILIAFQVHDDTQILYNSPLINKMDDILDFFYDDIKEILPDYNIIVKEHPVDLWRIDYSNLQKKYSDIIWIKKWNIWDYIEKSDFFICVNSSTWLQALSKYKKVITLWKNFYSNNPWVKNIKRRNEFKNELIKLKNQNIIKDKEEIDKYIEIYKKEIFISSGWLYNFDNKTIIDICASIINY